MVGEAWAPERQRPEVSQVINSAQWLPFPHWEEAWPLESPLSQLGEDRQGQQTH